jgi:DNA-binding NarL/FixJ family response regulator
LDLLDSTAKRIYSPSGRNMTNSANNSIGLILHGDREAINVRQTLLRTHGYIVLTAESAVEALNIVNQHPVHIALLDYHAGPKSSERLALALKERDPRTAIILDGCPGEVPEALLWLVDDYVLKAEPMDALQRAVGKCAKQRFAVQQPSSTALSTKR